MEILDYIWIRGGECSITGKQIGGSAVRLDDGRLIDAEVAEEILRNATLDSLLDGVEKGKLVNLDSLVDQGTSCPSQFEGETYDGGEVYVRFRHGSLRVDVDGETVYTGSPPGDGVISLENVRRHLKRNKVGI